MPTRISKCRWPPLFLITMAPIECKIIVFLKLVCLLFSCSRISVSQYASYSLIFNPLYSLKSIFRINPMWNARLLKRRSHAVIGLKVHVSLDHSVSLHLISLSVLLTLLVALHAKNNTRSAPTSTEVTQVSHWSHNVHTANCHLRSGGERNGAQRITEVSIGRTMMQTLELLLLQLAKRHTSQ